MKGNPVDPNRIDTRRIAIYAAVGVLLQWLAQPPMAFWPIGFFAIVPWLMIVASTGTISRRQYVAISLAGLVYWLVSLQGLRHAHPVMYLSWIVLASYLSIYGLLFVSVCRRWIKAGVPLLIAAPVCWVGAECIRNYFATGLSAAMLGHTMADVPSMIQIADVFGTYGVSFVVTSVNVALFELMMLLRRGGAKSKVIQAIVSATAIVASTLVYGSFRLNQQGSDTLATFALIQRSEVVEYSQNEEREAQIFRNYCNQSMMAMQSTEKAIAAVVWPESMFTGGLPWMIADESATPPDQFKNAPMEFQQRVQYSQESFTMRSSDLQRALSYGQPGRKRPQLIGGCAVLHFQDERKIYSAIVQVNENGNVIDWYGKTHLVLIGEYVPILQWIPVVRSVLPLLTRGHGPKLFSVGSTNVSPNICIETAVERVTVNQISNLLSDGLTPEVIVTVTNDGWFDDSSVIDHHLRCAQLVAVGVRRPILSAANNGPTVWIDSSGRLVERIATGDNGSIIATPKKDSRVSVYVRIGDWPARLCALACLFMFTRSIMEHLRQRRERRFEVSGDLGDEPLGIVET